MYLADIPEVMSVVVLSVFTSKANHCEHPAQRHECISLAFSEAKLRAGKMRHVSFGVHVPSIVGFFEWPALGICLENRPIDRLRTQS